MTMPSRLAQARKAVRPALKGRIMLSGVPGAGKTRTGLIVARELADSGNVLGIDTEKESMLTYADDFDFTHLPWKPPFDPAELTQTLREASGQYPVIFVDSFSHFWRGEGGVLDVAGGKFTGWKEARPLHEALVNAILESDSHIILGVRSKIGHAQEVENGRQVVRKLGMEDQQDDNLAFEMNVALELALDHVATVTKSRTTALPVGRSYGVDRTVEMACTYREWLKGGEEPVDQATAKQVKARLDALPDDQYRRRCKAEFRSAFGLPEQLRASTMDAVNGLLAHFENATPPTPPEPPAAASGTVGRRQAEGGGSTPEPSPEGQVEGSGGQVDNQGPEPSTTPAARMDTGRPVTNRQAQQLHRDLGRTADKDGYGLGGGDQDDLIYVVTSGRTTHASDLTVGEEALVRQFADNIREGRMSLGDVHRAADEHRTAQLDGALEQSIAAQDRQAS